MTTNIVTKALATTTPAASAPPTQTLNSADRCDTRDCGAQAYVRLTIKGSDLLFCAHHYTANESAIQALATTGQAHITDERWVLTNQEGASRAKGENHA